MTERERENGNEMWEEKSILRITETKSGWDLCKEKTGQDSQENLEKEVGDISPTKYYVFCQLYTVSTRIDRWIRGREIALNLGSSH